METLSPNVHDELQWMLAASRAPKLRTMRQFAEEEIVLAGGPYDGSKFKCSRQPFAGLWFDAVDSGLFNRFALTLPTQSGKSLCGWVIPAMYHLFETQDDVICFVPDKAMARDKWERDIKPCVQRSRYAALIPKTGLGSRGGEFDSITFLNGRTLKFMCGKGPDEARSAYTARVVVATEVDKSDEARGASREADPITQVEARTDAFGDRKRIYLECTVSIETGRIWTEYQAGTCSRIACRCPHCKGYVTPEREDLQGWQQAETEGQAERGAGFFCPACGERWTEAERAEANAHAVLLHKGQEVGTDGEALNADGSVSIVGAPPDTRTLGFRGSAVNNLLYGAGLLGIQEWKARHSDEDDAEIKSLQQFKWVVPHKPQKWDATPLSQEVIIGRTSSHRKGHVPGDSARLTMGVDVGKWKLHWVLTAWKVDGSPHVVEYGMIAVHSDYLSEEFAIIAALRELRDMSQKGWPINGIENVSPSLHVVDSGYKASAVYAFVAEKESGAQWLASKGCGFAQERKHYSAPKQTGAAVVWIGDQMHIAVLASRVKLLEVNSDHWKSFLHARIATPLGCAGALTLHEGKPHEHIDFAKHLTAEKEYSEYIEGKGVITRWEQVAKQNHWLDAGWLACAAASREGITLLAKQTRRKVEIPEERRRS